MAPAARAGPRGGRRLVDGVECSCVGGRDEVDQLPAAHGHRVLAWDASLHRPAKRVVDWARQQHRHARRTNRISPVWMGLPVVAQRTLEVSETSTRVECSMRSLGRRNLESINY